MIIHKLVDECDFTGDLFDCPVEGIAYLARGATGRWCEVMWGGPETLTKLQAEGAEILTAEEARARVEAMPDSYPDF